METHTQMKTIDINSDDSIRVCVGAGDKPGPSDRALNDPELKVAGQQGASLPNGSRCNHATRSYLPDPAVGNLSAQSAAVIAVLGDPSLRGRSGQLRAHARVA